MRTCADCDFMRVKIPVSDDKGQGQHIYYRQGVARCVKGQFVRKYDGQEQTFSRSKKGYIHIAWQKAETCIYYRDTGLEAEILDLLVKVLVPEKLIDLK